ncbi:MAG: hypothetical protein EBV06_10965 [Planctomycetia bacterium]|nr:hypothetical protein [Planctomycetia bacterium]
MNVVTLFISPTTSVVGCFVFSFVSIRFPNGSITIDELHLDCLLANQRVDKQLIGVLDPIRC